MTCTRSKTYFKNQKWGLEDGLAKQNIHLMHCRYESEAHNWSAGFPSAHALWSRLFSVHFKVLHATVANSANMQVSWGVRSLVFIYFSIVLLLQCSYYRTMSHRWSITSLLKSSWRIGDSWNLVKPNGFSRIKILRRGKPPWLAFFLPNAIIWAYLNHFRFVRLTVFRNKNTKNSTTEYRAALVPLQ